MITFPSGALLLVALLSGTANAAEPPPLARCAATSRFDVSVDLSNVAPDVCVSADEPTIFFSDRSEPGGLMGAAWLEQGGTIASKEFRNAKIYPANALRFKGGTAFSYTPTEGGQAISLSVWLLLSNPGAQPWTAAGASLLDSTGERVDLAAFQPAPILAGSEGNVVVGTEREPGHLACPCTVKLWDAPGTRVVTLGNIRFPDAPKPEH